MLHNLFFFNEFWLEKWGCLVKAPIEEEFSAFMFQVFVCVVDHVCSSGIQTNRNSAAIGLNSWLIKMHPANA